MSGKLLYSDTVEQAWALCGERAAGEAFSLSSRGQAEISGITYSSKSSILLELANEDFARKREARARRSWK